MKSDTKLIIGLIGLILILGSILALKVFGNNNQIENEEIVKFESSNIILDTQQYNSIIKYEREQTGLEKIIYFMIQNMLAISIIIFIINLILNIGMGKLYAKLSMPDWIVKFQYMYAIIVFILTFLPESLNSIILLILSIVNIIVSSYYFGTVGMSKIWPVVPIISVILIYLSVLTLGISAIIGIGLIIAYVIASAIANVRVGKELGKETLFIVGLVILPVIFLPILGYQGEN